MSRDSHPYVWQMVKEAVEVLGSPTTNVAVRDWILQKYAGTNTNTIQCQIIICTVNHTSRVHYPENKKPRLATDERYDFLFRPDRGRLESYDPARHGQWQIYEKEDGRLGVRQVDGDDALPEESEDTAQKEAGSGFAAEAHLRDYLAQHLAEVEPGLRLYVDDDGNDGVEYQTPVGRIDILAVDSGGAFAVIELKVARGPDSTAGQILRYKNWVKIHLAEGKAVRGIIIAQHISDKIRYAIAGDPDVTAKEYEISLKIRDAGDLAQDGTGR